MIYIILNRETPEANRGEAMLIEHPQGQMNWKQNYFPDADPKCVSVAPVDGRTKYEPRAYYTIFHQDEGGMDCRLYIEPGILESDVVAPPQTRTYITFEITHWVPPPDRGTFPPYPENGWKLDEAVISLCGRYRVILGFNCKGNVIYRVYHNTDYGLFFLDVCYNWPDVKTLCMLHAYQELLSESENL